MFTQRMQIQAIADLLAGIDHPNGRLRPNDFDSPWREIYLAIQDAPPGPDHKQKALKESLSAHPDGKQIIGDILMVKPGDRPHFPSLDELGPSLPPVEWLWPNWIPRGMLSLLGAIPGAGKSFLALDLARRIIAGDTFPDGAPVRTPGANVIYVDAEQVPQLINERAVAWEMDRARLFLMPPEPNDMIDFSRPEYQDRLTEMLYALQPALVVIDSLSSISSKGENNVEDVRGLLGFLSSVALDHNCALLLIHHLRKRGPLPLVDVLTIDDFRGSSHIIAMARSVLGLSVIQIGPEPDRNGPRRLEIVKTNLARYPQPIGVEFLPLHPHGVTLRYGDPPQRYREPTKTEGCAEWLLQLLDDEREPMKPKRIVELADDAGFSETLVYRARKQLEGRIVNTQGRRSPHNRWGLAEWWGDAAESEDQHP
jgi:hypothetical protein